MEKEPVTTLNKKMQKVLLCFSIIMIVIIILLLFQRALYFFINYRGKNDKFPTGNIDVFELKCNDNCTCSESNQFPKTSINLDNDSSLSDIFVSTGSLKFNEKTTNYNILLENNINKITLNAIKNSPKASLYYVYNKKVYSNFNDMDISVGTNIITIIVISESGNLSSYKVIITRLNENGEIIQSTPKDSNNNLINITISTGNLKFKKNKTNYTVYINDDIDKITLIATKESEKSKVSYIYNGKSYDEFKNINIVSNVNVVTVVVTAENGNSIYYVVNIKKTSDVSNIDGLQWHSVNDLNIFSNPIYDGEDIIAPGSSNSYEFVIKNVVDKKVRYQLKFKEQSKYAINMKYRLKRNGEYLIGNEKKWVSYKELDTTGLVISSNESDNYTLEWKWFDGENDNLIGKLQNDYILSISLSAILEE